MVLYDGKRSVNTDCYSPDNVVNEEIIYNQRMSN